MSRARPATAVAALTVSLVVTGCAGGTVAGHGRAVPGASIPSTTPSSSADFPTSLPPASSIPVPSLPTTAPPTRTNEDITDVKYRIPNGFVKSRAFHPVSPLERRYVSRYLVPSNERNGLDVISILYYRLPRYVQLHTLAQQKVRVRDYNRQAGARVTSGPHITLVDGRPAIQENAVQQRVYRYAAWFVFASKHLVQVSCQVDQQVHKIARGCQVVLKSMKFS